MLLRCGEMSGVSGRVICCQAERPFGFHAIAPLKLIVCVCVWEGGGVTGGKRFWRLVVARCWLGRNVS